MDVDEESSAPTKNISRPNEYLSIVPWRNAEEFIEVYEGLYSPCMYSKRWAVDRITVWETRCPSLLSAIEATVVLVGAVVQDMMYNVGSGFCQERDIQALYSMAIVRFVNLTLETVVKEKLAVLANKHNIPSWIVDLRHDATHASVPSLPMLRMGTEIALTYLKDTFWKQMAINIRPIIKTPSGVEEKVIDVISKFKQVQFSIREKTGDCSELEKDRQELIEIIRSLVKNHNQKFVTAFVKPGVFLSPEEIMQLLRIDGDILFLEDEDYLTLPDTMLKFWLAVFRILHTFELISYFLEMLLLSLENCRNILVQKTAAAWVTFLLTAASPGAPRSGLSQRFRAKGVQLNLKRLLHASMKGINRFTLNVFMLIGNRLGNPWKHHQLYYLMAMQVGMLVTPNTNKSPSLKSKKDAIVFTVEDVEEDYLEAKTQQQPKKKKNIWSLASVNMNFDIYPLGAIINPADKPRIKGETVCEEVAMDTSVEESFITFDESDIEPTAEVKSTPDNILLESEIGDMIYSR